MIWSLWASNYVIQSSNFAFQGTWAWNSGDGIETTPMGIWYLAWASQDHGWCQLHKSVSCPSTNLHVASLGQATRDSSHAGLSCWLGSFQVFQVGKHSHGVMSNQVTAGRVISNKPWLASMGLTPHPSPHKSSRLWHRGLFNKAVNWTRRKQFSLHVRA